jgi:hypothetical protein
MNVVGPHSLPRYLRVITLYVAVAMAFAVGVVISRVAPIGPLGTAACAVMVVCGAMYGTALAMYLWLDRLKRGLSNRKPSTFRGPPVSSD